MSIQNHNEAFSVFSKNLTRWKQWVESFTGYRKEAGILFAETLLGQQDTVKEWMVARAASTAGDRLQRGVQDQDIPLFLERFFPGQSGLLEQIPDCGSVICHLRMSINWMAGQKGCTIYAW